MSTEQSEVLIKKIRRTSGDIEEECNSNHTNQTKVPRAELFKEANEALRESNKLHVRPIIDEAKLGIELFVGDKKDEFHGLIKTRYADFIVHEIDPGGNMAQLTKLDPPEEEKPAECPNLKDFIDDKALECLFEINNGYLNEYKIDVTGMSKDSRTNLHHAIRNAFEKLDSVTVCETDKNQGQQNDDGSTKDKQAETEVSMQQVAQNGGDKSEASDSNVSVEKKYIVVKKRNKVSRPKNVWPKDRPDHTHFILYKENKDTMDAIHNLAAAINTRPSNFSSAGIKDKRAITTQWLSSWRLEPRRLIAACRRFNRRPFIKVGNFCFKKEPITLGQLKANKFDIVIRHLVYNNEGSRSIDKAMQSISGKGFVNYFGLQRFGTRSIQTHEIGLAILQSKWDKAVDLVLSYRFDDNMQQPQTQKSEELQPDYNDTSLATPTESRKIDRFKQDNRGWTNGAEQHNSFIDLWKTKLDAEIVFKKYPHFRFTNEGLIMKALSKSEEASQDYLNAMISLPRNTRSIYVHSYQSLLWNKLTTYRLKKHDFKVIVGDLILTSDANVSDNSLDILLLSDEIDVATDNKSNTGTTESDVTSTTQNKRRAPIEEIESKIIVATEKDLNRYSIFDVVLPIIGSRVRLPQNDVADELQRLLALDNLCIESFKIREKTFISYGSYRKIMVKPANVNWKIKQYSNPQQNLIETDLDQLSKDKEYHDYKPTVSPKSDSSDEALVVEFELPPSSYATMCLREIMKKPSTDFNSKF